MTDESVFAAALAIPSPADRAAYLARACAGNPALRAEVDALLAAHAASNPLDRPPADLGATGGYEPADGPPAAAVGDRVGPYRLMEQIGEGGMGLVFVAEQTEPVRRKVALKVIKPGMDTRQVVARFEAERQALALMDHPNIARVLDAGATPEGRPYFVMELVRGLPITDYCDQQTLPPRERLALFVQVCQAVQHAHQKGVIHRDIKPSNVLVAPHDGVPVVKVIDFGVAKAVGQSLTDKTIYTRVAQMVGTPLYMSPEQAELNQLDVDTRADVYALGVLLYELLTGTTPFDGDRFRKAAFDEIRRILREEDPPRPSTRLTSLGETLTGVSARRGTQPGKLAGLVRGELDWIVMKCLEKDRNRRYDSAAGLAKDVQRHLAGELVEARPPTLGYRVRKYCHRHRAALLVALLFVVTLKATTLFSIWQASRAFIAEAFAEQQRDEAEAARHAEADRRVEAERLGDDLRRANYQSTIRLAAAETEAGQVRVARELLERIRPAPGQPGPFEWNYLRRRLNSERLSIPEGRPGLEPRECAFSPDGRHLAIYSEPPFDSGRTAGELWFWDLREGRVQGTTPLARNLGEFTYTPDGRHLAFTTFPLGSNDAEYYTDVWLHDVLRKERRRVVRLDGEGAYAVAVSPDGTRVAVLRKAGGAVRVKGVTVHDAATGVRVGSVPGGGEDGHLAFDAAGRLVVALVRENGVTLQDDAGGPARTVLDLRSIGAEVRDLRLDAAATRLAVGTSDRQVRVWDLTGGAPVLLSMFPVDSIGLTSRLYLSADGRYCSITDLVSSPGVPVWDVRTGTRVLFGRGHEQPVSKLAFAPDGRTLATASRDGTVKLWDLPEPRRKGADLIASMGVADLVARGNEGFTAVAYESAGAASGYRVLDVGSGKIIGRLPDRVAASPSVLSPGRLSPDGRRMLVSADTANRYHVTDVETGERLATLPAEGVAAVRGKFLTPDLLLVEPPAGGGEVWELATGRRSPSPFGDVVLPHAVASRDGTRVAVVRPDMTVHVLNAVTGAGVRQITPIPGAAPQASFLRGRITRMALSDDGEQLACNFTGMPVVYDVRTGEARQFRGHGGVVRGAVLSPDGRRLFSVGSDQTVRVWDTATGQELLAIRCDGDPRAVAVSPDGHRLAVQSWQNGRGEIFDATPLPESKP